MFEGYTGSGADNRRPASAGPGRPGGYGYGYPGSNGAAGGGNLGVEKRAYRPATPNSKYVFGYWTLIACDAMDGVEALIRASELTLLARRSLGDSTAAPSWMSSRAKTMHRSRA